MRPSLAPLAATTALIAALVCGVSTTSAAAGESSTAPAASSASSVSRDVSPTTYASQFNRAVNRARAQADRRRLGVDTCMTRLAVASARRMAAAGDVNDTVSVNEVDRRCDLHAVTQQSAVGGSDGTRTLQRVYLRYARDLVLDRRWRIQASAARQAADGTWYVMAIFAERT